MKSRRTLAVIGRLRPVIGAGPAVRGRGVPLSLFWRRRARPAPVVGPPVIQRFSFNTALTFRIHLHPPHSAAPDARFVATRLTAPLARTTPLRRKGRTAGTERPQQFGPAAPAQPTRARVERAAPPLDHSAATPAAAARPLSLALRRGPAAPIAPLESIRLASRRAQAISNPPPDRTPRTATLSPAHRLPRRQRLLASLPRPARISAPSSAQPEDRPPALVHGLRNAVAGPSRARLATRPAPFVAGRRPGPQRRAPIDLTWRGGRGGDCSPGPAPVAEAAAESALAQSAVTAPSPFGPAAQAAVAPPIDRLVDEVLRRLDRSGRVERERRGL